MLVCPWWTSRAFCLLLLLLLCQLVSFVQCKENQGDVDSTRQLSRPFLEPHLANSTDQPSKDKTPFLLQSAENGHDDSNNSGEFLQTPNANFAEETEVKATKHVKNSSTNTNTNTNTYAYANSNTNTNTNTNTNAKTKTNTDTQLPSLDGKYTQQPETTQCHRLKTTAAVLVVVLIVVFVGLMHFKVCAHIRETCCTSEEGRKESSKIWGTSPSPSMSDTQKRHLYHRQRSWMHVLTAKLKKVCVTLYKRSYKGDSKNVSTSCAEGVIISGSERGLGNKWDYSLLAAETEMSNV